MQVLELLRASPVPSIETVSLMIIHRSRHPVPSSFGKHEYNLRGQGLENSFIEWLREIRNRSHLANGGEIKAIHDPAVLRGQVIPCQQDDLNGLFLDFP